MLKLLLVIIVTLSSSAAIAAQFSGSQTDSVTWTYTLTFDPQDNYACQDPTTITVSGLTGVTAAGLPTSTDFPAGMLNDENLKWTAQVLEEGSKVVWTAGGSGTGNMPDAYNVFGFTITANAFSGDAPFVTDGYATDAPQCVDRDASGNVAGPTIGLPTPVPTAPLFGLGILVSLLGLFGLRKLRQ